MLVVCHSELISLGKALIFVRQTSKKTSSSREEYEELDIAQHDIF